MTYSKIEDIIIKKSKEKIILFVHGIFSTPVEFTDFYNRYDKEDYSIYGIKLLPHSLDPKEYMKIKNELWQSQIDKLLDKLLDSYKEVNIIAHSLGCLLALRAKNINKVNKLVLWAPAIKKKISYTSIKVGLEIGTDEYYEKLPEFSGVEAKNLLDRVRLLRSTMYLFPAGRKAVKSLPYITTDTLVICSKKDESVRTESGNVIMRKIGSTHKQLITLKHSYHNLIDQKEEFIYDDIINFIKEKALN